MVQWDSTLAAMVGGELAALLAFGWLVQHLFRKRRQRLIALEVQPPDCGRLLRPPGHWLQEKLFALNEKQNDEISSAAMWTILCGIIGAASLVIGAQAFGDYQTFTHALARYCAIGAGFGLMLATGFGLRAARSGNRLLELKDQVERTRLGLRGEQAVAEVLQTPEITAAGYFTFHDVPSDGGGNIDHIVIGPGGVFVIETKARSQRKPRRGKLRNRLHFDGKTAEFPSGSWDGEATAQVEQNANCVASWLNAVVPNVTVVPLLIFPGWVVHGTTRSRVIAMSSRSLTFHFAGRVECFDDAQLRAMRGIIDRRCRDVSF